MARRKIQKRIDLNEYEAGLLYAKARSSNLTEAEYLRTCILGSCPVEAPPRQFYIEMQNLNKIGTNINQIAHRANESGSVSQSDIELLKKYHEEIQDEIFKIKEIVLSARPYYPTTFEYYLAQVEEAKKKNKPKPSPLDTYQPEPEYITDLTDPEIGRNYLGIGSPINGEPIE